MYTIIWNFDGTKYTETYLYGEQVKFSIQVPTYEGKPYKYGYEFRGWATEENGEVVELGAVSKDIEYYAVFSDTSVWDGVIPTLPSGATADTLFDKDSSGNYLIQSATDMAEFSALTAKVHYGNGTKTFKLTINLDLNHPQNAWQPICMQTVNESNAKVYCYFKDNFDGSNKTVDLRVDSDKSGMGLFAGVQGYVHDLTINGSVSALDWFGTLAGYAAGSAVIENITNNASVTGDGTVGQVGGPILYISEAIFLPKNYHYQ